MDGKWEYDAIAKNGKWALCTKSCWVACVCSTCHETKDHKLWKDYNRGYYTCIFIYIFVENYTVYGTKMLTDL